LIKKILIILLITLSACTEQSDDIVEENNLIKVVFATDWKAQAEQGGFYQALAAGLYTEKGLNVKIIQGNSNVNVPRLIASNTVEFGIGSNSFIPLNMAENKIPGKAIMAIFQKDPQIIMTHLSSNVESLEDMVGLPIMISDASIG
jgi:NitT/TauT family transport system substrate-binding protein